MTIMFTAFEGGPLILRLYGTARAVHQKDADWGELVELFSPLPGMRQIFDVNIDLVQTSCGMATPYFDYVSDRELLNDWAKRKGDGGIQDYWREKNQVSLDGKPTLILEKNI